MEAAGRDPSAVVTSVMTWVFVGASEGEWRARLERAREVDPDMDEEWVQRVCIIGTPDQAAERLTAYADAGAQRMMLNHALFDDVDMLELLAAEVFPRVTTAAD